MRTVTTDLLCSSGVHVEPMLAQNSHFSVEQRSTPLIVCQHLSGATPRMQHVSCFQAANEIAWGLQFLSVLIALCLIGAAGLAAVSIIAGKQSTWLYYTSNANPPYKVQCARRRCSTRLARTACCHRKGGLLWLLL